MCRCSTSIQIGKICFVRRRMYISKRLTKRKKICRAEIYRYNTINVGQKTIHHFTHDPAHRFLMYPLRQRIDRHNSSEISRVSSQYRLNCAPFRQPLHIRMMYFTLIPELVHLSAKNTDTPYLPGSLHPDSIGMKPLAGYCAGGVLEQHLEYAPTTFGPSRIGRENSA